MNVSEPVRRNAQLAPDAPAYLRTDGTSISYAELENTIDALAHRLRDLDLGPGQAAVCGTDDVYRYLVMTLALARIGAIAAPVTLPVEFADVAFEEDGIKVPDARRVVPLADLWPPGLPAGATQPPAALHENDSAPLAYCPSSGTTSGTPRFVPITHDCMRQWILIRERTLPVRPGEGHAHFVAPASMLGLSGRLRTLWGRGVVLEPNLDARKTASWFATAQIGYISISPIGLRKVLEVLRPAGVSSAIRTIEVAGGHLHQDLCELARQRLPAQLLCDYGSTESGPVASAPAAALARPGAVGYAREGVDVEIVDAEDRPVERGREGFVRVRSKATARGYVGSPDAAATVFRDGWVYPSDLGILEPDGLLRILGRVDDVINHGGIKIHPNDLEDALRELADLREVAVFSATVGAGTQALCAAIVSNVPLDADAFHARCREHLRGKAPELIIYLRELPRNAAGKVMRAELERLLIAGLRARRATQ